MPKPDLTPSYFETVADVLEVLAHDHVNGTTKDSRAAKAAIPDRYPQAQLFMAWASYYKTPDPRTETKKAMNFQ
jgi:hypothetical protein